MRFSKHIICILVGLACITGRAADLAALKDPHLSIIERTKEEQSRIDNIIQPTKDFSKAEPFEKNAGGAGTVHGITNRDAFSQPSKNMPFESELDFRVGNGFFRKLWVSSPASTQASDGLGPVFNARACQRCHLKDGRGHPPDDNHPESVSMFLRLSIPKAKSALEQAKLAKMPNAPEPTYGLQLQDKSVANVPAEGQMQIEYETFTVKMEHGETVELRQPKYAVSHLGYGDLHDDVQLSPRIANQMIGLGLLEAIPTADILALADENDENNDGISGKAQVVWSPLHDDWMLGRFGHKAGNATIKEQSAHAFAGDIGISTPLLPNHHGECTENQEACLKAPNGASEQFENLEAPSNVLDLVTFYSQNLAVPARRNVNDKQVLQGKKVFYEIGCTSCHTPKHVTHRLENQPAQSFQLIWPYTDLLLHDMGEGLADNRPEWRANGREWRTPPLWGIGLTKTVSEHTFFLHDGRARNLTEAILWHGGEAQASREAFRKLSKADHEAIIRFLESL